MGSHDFTDSQTGRGGLESPSPRSATTAAAAVTTAATAVIVTAAAAAAAAAVTVVTLSRLIDTFSNVFHHYPLAVLESLNPYETAFVINQECQWTQARWTQSAWKKVDVSTTREEFANPLLSFVYKGDMSRASAQFHDRWNNEL
ncbi:hypothetical protein HZH66_006195 [Vespula vulgaris]|uniref:Uncharacterized protein n=1 Tax=Vespula vulgaris TaxID=7454 RepID=A0A834KBT3_VESVU|nr:hypothetical protein HZH66_006195 [Vespula vulgaris]